MSSIYFWEDIIKDLPICKSLTDNFEKIRREILNYIEKNDVLIDYPKYTINYSGYFKGQQLYDNTWKALPLSRFCDEHIDINGDGESDIHELAKNVTKNAQDNLPFTYSLIKELETSDILANCFISRLEPGSVIHPHRGFTDKYMRIHLGIICDPMCKITVGTETKSWEEGKILAFLDGGIPMHSVKHEGNHSRIILSMDVRISYIADFIKNNNVL